MADDRWGSSRGFLLAALGSAIGLGNIWRFPTVAGEHGGGAFLLAYLLAVLLLGVPLLIAELAIGRAGRAGPLRSFSGIAPEPPWRHAGALGTAALLGILCYYPLIAGWVCDALWHVATEGVRGGGAPAQLARFDALLADPARGLFWLGVVITLAGAVVAAGVAAGIERASRVLMPAFALLLLALAVHGLSLPGAPRALAFLFTPDWQALLVGRTWLAATGQAFFSIGLAMGILVAYGAYLPDDERLPRAALAIALGDTLVAIIAGLVIFPAAFTYGFDPAAGTVLVFSVLPEVFAALPGGRVVALGFYLLLLLAALTSIVSMMEVPVALLRTRGWRRREATLLVAFLAALAGVPVALWFLPGAPPLPFGSLLGLLDKVAADLMLPLSGIAIALFAGWRWPADNAIRAAGLAPGALGATWLWTLRVVVPLALAAAAVQGMLA